MKPVTLECPRCGAPLEVTPEVDHCTCGFCGAREIVRRRGSMVFLKPLDELVGRIQSPAARIASDLALERLTQDLCEMETATEREVAARKHGSAWLAFALTDCAGAAWSVVLDQPAVCAFFTSLLSVGALFWCVAKIRAAV
jgi:DNA-directed RNA polymerase subunit RPC12/RpoP